MQNKGNDERSSHILPPINLSEDEDDSVIRAKYRPFLLSHGVERDDWISELELETVMGMARKDLNKTGSRLKVLVLYGSLRKR